MCGACCWVTGGWKGGMLASLAGGGLKGGWLVECSDVLGVRSLTNTRLAGRRTDLAH